MTPQPSMDNSYPAATSNSGKTEWTTATAEPPPQLRPHVTPILKVRRETPRVKSFILRAPTIAREASPGQFLMVWIPGVDEIPMSIAAANPKTGLVEFAAARVGDATTKLHQAKPGTPLGLRGPLGHGFTLPPKPQGPLLLVAGGCGAAPLLFAASWASANGWDVHMVLGAPTAHELLYRRRFRRHTTTLLLTTDDGTAGMKGTTVDGAAHLLKVHGHASTPYSACLACGPEPMLKALVRLTKRHRVPLQLSLERYMKCGVGLCGHCVIDRQGTRICTEGPVLPAAKIEGTDFGALTRDATGRRQPL